MPRRRSPTAPAGCSPERAALGEPPTPEDIARAAEDGDALAIQLIQRSARVVGESIAGLVNVLNPGLIVIGGAVAAAGELFLAEVRQRVYELSLPLATRDLTIVQSVNDVGEPLRGGFELAREQLFEVTFPRWFAGRAADHRRRPGGLIRSSRIVTACRVLLDDALRVTARRKRGARQPPLDPVPADAHPFATSTSRSTATCTRSPIRRHGRTWWFIQDRIVLTGPAIDQGEHEITVSFTLEIPYLAAGPDGPLRLPFRETRTLTPVEPHQGAGLDVAA